jgi:hypothetical protein
MPPFLYMKLCCEYCDFALLICNHYVFGFHQLGYSCSFQWVKFSILASSNYEREIRMRGFYAALQISLLFFPWMGIFILTHLQAHCCSDQIGFIQLLVNISFTFHDFIRCWVFLVRTRKKFHSLCEPGFVGPCVSNLTEESSCGIIY